MSNMFIKLQDGTIINVLCVTSVEVIHERERKAWEGAGIDAYCRVWMKGRELSWYGTQKDYERLCDVLEQVRAQLTDD